VKSDFQLRSNLMPFFWVKLVVPALLMGAIGSGCSAGSVDDAPHFDDTPSTPAATPASNAAQNPRPAPAAPASGATTNASTTPASNTASGSAANTAGSSSNAANGAANDGDEALPTPALDPGAAPEEQDESGANAGSDDQNAADDDDGDDDEIGDDNGGDDDDGDDDGGGDDDGEDDDDGDDDDDGTGATPPPPPPVNPGSDAVTFTADIRPILLDNCGRCHASGGLPRFASNDAASSFDVAVQERNSIISEIQRGSMPADTCNGAPGSNGCVSVADFDLIRQWVAAGTPE
jgi:hypothetical protein